MACEKLMELFQTFLTIEELVREEPCLAKSTFDTRKLQIVEKVVTTDNVLYQWQWSICILDAMIFKLIKNLPECPLVLFSYANNY